MNYLHERQLREILETLEREGCYEEIKGYTQHGNTSVYTHCVMVAQQSCKLAELLHIKVNYDALIRGALLHDYFRYDWHVPSPKHRLHGFSHPYTAARNAKAEYDVSELEALIIKRHMFPLVPIPPTSREGWIVCVADKIIATKETVNRR